MPLVSLSLSRLPCLPVSHSLTHILSFFRLLSLFSRIPPRVRETTESVRFAERNCVQLGLRLQVKRIPGPFAVLPQEVLHFLRKRDGRMSKCDDGSRSRSRQMMEGEESSRTGSASTGARGVESEGRRGECDVSRSGDERLPRSLERKRVRASEEARE